MNLKSGSRDERLQQNSISALSASRGRLVDSDQPSRYQNALENVGEGELEGEGVNAMFSVGLFLDQQRKVKDVLWNGPAFKAWLAPSMELVAIDGHPYSTAVLRSEIAQAQKNRKALQITAKGDGVTEVYVLDYDDGLDCPHLVRVPRATDYLQQILAPKPLDNGS